MQDNTFYEDGRAQPAYRKAKPTGTGPDMAFHALTCRRGSPGCGWFKIPKGTIYMTGTTGERPEIRKADTNFHWFQAQYCDISDVGPGCGWFRMEEGTLYEGPDMSRDDRRVHMNKAGEAQAYYLKTCFPEIRTADYDGRRLEHPKP